MLILISPAKSLDYETPVPNFNLGIPTFSKNSQVLVKRMRKLNAQDLAKLMSISDDLAQLNVQRFKDWNIKYPADKTRAAIYAFSGDVYKTFAAATLSEEDILYTQDHLRILSGLYGLLKPLDALQPYRLEMGTKIQVDEEHKNLYSFWGSSITKEINEAAKDEPIINLASDEYFKAVKKDLLQNPLIDIKFLNEKNGVYKVIGFSAKRARGLLARFIIQNRLTKVADLHNFNEAGYIFSKVDSTETLLVFKCPESTTSLIKLVIV